ncbi:CYTH domain-containing protein [Leucobacter zeae]|nr:CYTH domain-containing protein [Leucobacter zeae]
MTQQQGVEALEIERKYEVPAGGELPGGAAFARVGLAADEPVVHRLEAEYFDTADGSLARAGLAMRVRRGGKDAGWHLKHRRTEGVRELMWPAGERIPDELVAAAAAGAGIAIGAADLRVIARMRTERTVVMLRAGDGAAVVELADDRVRAEDRSTDPEVRRAWREWEAELMPEAGVELLDVVEPILLAAGAVPSLSPAKIARATGRLVGLARSRGASDAELAALEALDASDQEAARRLEA